MRRPVPFLLWEGGWPYSCLPAFRNLLQKVFGTQRGEQVSPLD